MNHWPAPVRPKDHAESALVSAILDGSFLPGSTLPGERTLATQLGVTRPTLREAIQRLARDGWLTVSQGRPTVVNNFWEDGGLNVLGALVENSAFLPPDFVPNLLEVRLHLAPAYVRAAVDGAPSQVVALLEPAGELADRPADFAAFDWALHHGLTVYSGNPIYTLILNGFRGFYQDVGRQYFALPTARERSRAFYAALAGAAAEGDADRAEAVCRTVMEESIVVWRQAIAV